MDGKDRVFSSTAYRPSIVSNPFSAGLRSARANLLPGLVIQLLMIALVAAYYFFPPSRSCFQVLAMAKARWGYGFSFFVSIIAGALLPAIFKAAVLRRVRVSRGDWSEFVFLCLFWGVDGVLIDGFYRLQAGVFGAHADFPTVFKKLLVDQFIYNPLFAAPYAISWFEFKNRHYRWSTMGNVFTFDFYRAHTIPALFATWAVWIPVTSAIYSLPSLLQIPLFALALTFWSLLLIHLTSRGDSGAAHPVTLPQPLAD